MFPLRKYAPALGPFLKGCPQVLPASPSELSWVCRQWFWALELQKLFAGDSTDFYCPQEAIVTSVELGEDWERTEVLHKKFEEFQVELAARQEKVDGINQYANECAKVRSKGSCKAKVLASRTSQPSVGGT